MISLATARPLPHSNPLMTGSRVFTLMPPLHNRRFLIGISKGKPQKTSDAWQSLPQMTLRPSLSLAYPDQTPLWWSRCSPVIQKSAHWQQQWPGKLYRIRYASLVQNTRSELQQLLEYLRLPFDSACLSFDHNRRLVFTPSAAQVTKLAYTTSICRWQHYASHLEPLYTSVAR